ncbi:hypothetical protein ABW19_dt0208127 [Dactylella cylindrospora]|nr:hypothetical protein ABW19_dt0208127 [Dactylella cylindrospora]
MPFTKSIASRLEYLFSKLKTSKVTKLSPEQEKVLTMHFSPRILSIFSHTHLINFIPSSSSASSIVTSPEQETNMDEAIVHHIMKPSHYEDFGRIYDSGKLGRGLVALGMDEEFVQGYLKWKRELLGVTFDGCGWNEEWVYEIGGVRGAVVDILRNF